MAYVTQEARQELLDSIAEAADELASGLAAVGAAYEQLDDASGDQLEDALFRPLQTAVGRLKKTHGDYSARYQIAPHVFMPAPAPAVHHRVKDLLEQAAEAAEQAESILAELQDTGMTVEVGDQELRAGVAETRRMLAHVVSAADAAISRFGR